MFEDLNTGFSPEPYITAIRYAHFTGRGYLVFCNVRAIRMNWFRPFARIRIYFQRAMTL